jgi:hypothetical protein
VPSLLTLLETRQLWPLVMGLGLAMVLLAVLGSGLAVLTGVALIALGAGGSLFQRDHGARRVDILLLHAVVYATLYALFLGATLNASGLPPLVAADIAASLVVLGYLARLFRARLAG